MNDCCCKAGQGGVRFEELMDVKSPLRDNCCEVYFAGKEREFALQEQLNRERVQSCIKIAQANECCCKMRNSF